MFGVFLKMQISIFHIKRAHKFVEIVLYPYVSLGQKNPIYIKTVINLFTFSFFQNIVYLLIFSSFSRYCQTITMGKGFGRVYNHIQKNFTYPYPNTTFFVPPCSLLSSQHNSTNYFGITIIPIKQPLAVSNITNKN